MSTRKRKWFEENGCVIYGQNETDSKQIASFAKRANGYQCMDIKNDKGVTYNCQAFEGDAMVLTTEQRLCSGFLQLLGRTEREDYEVVEGVPDVQLKKNIHELNPSDSIEISASILDQISSSNIKTSWEEVFGPKTWSITIQELQRCEQGTLIAMSPVLPPLFYKALLQLTTDPDYCELYSILRSIPLYKVSTVEARESTMRNLETRLVSSQRELQNLDPSQDPWDTYVCKTAITGCTRSIDYLNNLHKRSSTAWRELLISILRKPKDFGFRTLSDAKHTLSYSLTELCTSVCISQHGYYFVDGTGDTMNQIAPLTPDTVVFLSAPGLDFCTDSTTRLEMPKYFEPVDGTTDQSELHTRYRGFKEGGEELLRKRVKNLYRVIFTSAKIQGVKNPSMLPMGLGVFLFNVNKADHDGVKEAYFSAQFELLSEEDWGFETYWLNPAQHLPIAKKLLKAQEEVSSYKCNVVLHNRDAKFLAVEMAKERMKPAVLNPSDCIAVMQGLIGYYWEIGRGDRYVGEEDFAATSTGILARCGISQVYTDLSRMVQVYTTEESNTIERKYDSVLHYCEKSLFAINEPTAWNTRDLLDVSHRANPFSRMDISPAGHDRVNAGRFVKSKTFPPTLRLAYQFLLKIGRLTDTKHITEVVEGVPTVVLETPLHKLNSSETISICANDFDATYLYGSRTFSISVEVLKDLEKTTRIVLGSDIPKGFYVEVVRLSTNPEYAQFFSYLRSYPLKVLGTSESWNSVLGYERIRRDVTNKQLDDLRRVSIDDADLDSEDDHLWDVYVAETTVRNSTRQISFFSDQEEDSPLLKAVRQWNSLITSFRRYPRRFGFSDLSHLEETLSYSLTELCTSVCISQHGYYFVDGTGDTMNQIAPLTPDTVVFLSAPGLDFCTDSTTRLEMPKYFEPVDGTTDQSELHTRYRGFKEGGEELLRKRVKNLYRVIFTSAKIQGVKNPSMLPMGLGVFLFNVNKADHDGVKEAYFSAQFELLSEEDWGFETYWLNPAQHKATAERLLESDKYNFKCNVAIHGKDAKFLAVEMAKERMKPAVLNPSDCIAVMQGLIGYYWEIGRGDRYVGEEDLVATSTGILSRCGITDVYSDTTRIVQLDSTQIESRQSHPMVEVRDGNFTYFLTAASERVIPDKNLHQVALRAGSQQKDYSLLAKRIPVQLTTVFLQALGRTNEQDHVVEGIPDVKLAVDVCDIDEGEVFRISSQDVNNFCSEHLNGCDTETDVVFGNKIWEIDGRSVRRLESTTRITLGSEIPIVFYQKMSSYITREDHLEFYSSLSTVPLDNLDHPNEWLTCKQGCEVRRKLAAARVSVLKSKHKSALKSDNEGNQKLNDIERQLGVEESIIRNTTSYIDLLSDSEKCFEVASEWRSFIKLISNNPIAYGFDSNCHFVRILSLSLTELCTSVCISQHGYYFVDGTGDTMNQIAPLTPDTVVFLSAPGLDFCTDSTTRLEMPKYFEPVDGTTDQSELHTRYRGFKEGGEELLRKRVKNLYQVIFTSAKIQGVKNPSMLPMGLGVFLFNVNKADHDGVKEAYFSAQFELLSEEDWGFETYWLNPGDFYEKALRMLRELKLFPKCDVVLHDREANFLAVEMAKERMKPAVLNPSDYIAVMQGLIGRYWEIGREHRYTREEHNAATSTAILARCGLSNVYTDHNRIIQVSQQHDLTQQELSIEAEDNSDLSESEYVDCEEDFEEITIESVYTAIVYISELYRRQLQLETREQIIPRIKDLCISRGPVIWREKSPFYRQTLICLAASHGDLPVVKLFVDLGCPLHDGGCVYQNTPLHAAALHCHLEVVYYLIENGHHLSILSEKGESVFDSALRLVGFQDCGQKTATMASVCFKVLQAAPTITEQSGQQLLDVFDPDGDELIERWAHQIQLKHSTDLHLAVMIGTRQDVIDCVIRKAKRGDHTSQQVVDARDQNGLTALHWGVIRNNQSAIKSLLGASDASMRAKVDVEDNDGWTPIQWAVCIGNVPCVEALLQQNPDILKSMLLSQQNHFVNSIWEDNSDSQKYTLRLHNEISPGRGAALGVWLPKMRVTKEQILRRSFAGVQCFQGKDVDVQVDFELITETTSDFTARVTISESSMVVWHGVYSAKLGIIKRRCCDWIASCRFINERCENCGSRDFLPAGLIPSARRLRATRGLSEMSSFHICCKAATQQYSRSLVVACPAAGAVGMVILRALLGGTNYAARLKHKKYQNAMLRLDSDNNTVFSMAVKAMRRESSFLVGSSVVRVLLGQELVQQNDIIKSPKHLDRIPDECWKPSPAEVAVFCLDSLRRTEQLIPSSLAIRSPRSPQIDGTYERREYCGRNGWPEYRKSSEGTKGGKTFILFAEDSGRWVITQEGLRDTQLLFRSQLHCGSLPHHIESWERNSTTENINKQPNWESTSPQFSVESTTDNSTSIPKDYSSAGWLLTLRTRCRDNGVAAFLRWMQPAGSFYIKSCIYCALNACVLPGRKGEGDTRLINEALSLRQLDGVFSGSETATEMGSSDDATTLGRCLHVAAVFSRKVTIQTLISDYNAVVEDRHIRTAVEWEQWSEASELLSCIRVRNKSCRPLIHFTNSEMMSDGQIIYSSLPSQAEIHFCIENDAATPEAFIDISRQLLCILKRLLGLSDGKSQRTLRQTQTRPKETWALADRVSQDTLRYLLSTPALNYTEVLSGSESRKSFDGFDFGATQRSAELFYSLAKILSSPDVVGLSAFPSGFSVAGVHFLPFDYTTFMFPIHQLLLKSEIPSNSSEDAVDYHKKCRSLLIQFVKLVNVNPETMIDVASTAPSISDTDTGECGSNMLKTNQPSQPQTQSKHSAEYTLLVDVVHRTKVSGFFGSFLKRAVEDKSQQRYENLLNSRHMILPIELAIDLGYADVVDSMLRGGVLSSDEINCEDISQDRVKAICYRDIWFPDSAEYKDSEIGTVIPHILNMNQYSGRAPLLHRALNSISIGIPGYDDIRLIRNRQRTLAEGEPPDIPCFPPSGKFTPTQRQSSDDSDRRRIVLLLLRSNIPRTFLERRSAGKYKTVRHIFVVEEETKQKLRLGPMFDRCGVYAEGDPYWSKKTLFTSYCATAAALVLSFSNYLLSDVDNDSGIRLPKSNRSLFIDNLPDSKQFVPIVIPPQEFGLAKLFQRAPWITTYHQLVQHILSVHPFNGIRELDAAVQRSETFIYLERRHFWSRTLRRVSRGFVEAPPGEQILLRDSCLSLPHWMTLIGSDDLLRVILFDMRLPVACFDRITTQYSPISTSSLGYIPVHYAAYSASIGSITCIVQKSTISGATECILNYQARCRCHPYQSWSSESDIHHNGIMLTTGDSPLMIASQFGHFLVSSALLEAGALSHLLNHENTDCHDIAVALTFRHVHQCRDEEGKQGDLITSSVLQRLTDLLNADDKIHKKLQRFASHRALSSGFVYMVFVICLMVVSFVLTHNNGIDYRISFWSAYSVHSAVTDQKSPPLEDSLNRLLPYTQDLTDVTTISDFNRWMIAALPKVLLKNTTYIVNDVCYEPGMYGTYSLVGAVRVSLIRTKPEECRGSTPYRCLLTDNTTFLFDGNPLKCWGEYSKDKVDESKKDYLKFASTGELGYTSPRTLIAYDIGTGEVSDFTPSNMEIINKVTESDYIDPSVRLLTLFATYYNPNIDSFLVVRIYAEVLAQGIVLPGVSIKTIKLSTPWNNVTFRDVLIFCVELLLYSFTVKFLIDEAMDLCDSLGEIASRLRQHISTSRRKYHQLTTTRQLPERKYKPSTHMNDHIRTQPDDNTDKFNPRQDSIRNSTITLPIPPENHIVTVETDPASIPITTIMCKCHECQGRKAVNVREKILFCFIFVKGCAEIIIWELIRHLFTNWNFIDVMLVILLGYTAVLRIQVSVLTVDIRNDSPLYSVDNHFVEFSLISEKQSLLHITLGTTVLIAWIKVLKLIIVVPKLGPVVGAIISTMANVKVCLFFLLFIEVLWAFISAFHLSFGDQLEPYSSLSESLFTTVRIVLGDYPSQGGFDDLRALSPPFAPILFVCLLVFGQLLFLNILIAVVSEVYTKAIEVTNEEWSKDINEMYQYSVCQLADPTDGQFSEIYQRVLISTSIPCLTYRPSDSRIKTSASDDEKWTIIYDANRRAYTNQIHIEHLGLAEVDGHLSGQLKIILSKIDELQRSQTAQGMTTFN